MGDTSMRDVFFEECEDLVAALTEGLGAMHGGQTDDATINAVFRAVHSVKGAAGAFALDDLVSFAHTFETVLDAIRSHKISLTPELLPVLQRAADVLADLIDTARDNQPTNAARVTPVLAELRNFLDDTPAPPEDFVFEALSLDFDAPQAPSKYKVAFRPTTAFYKSGNDPYLVVKALQSLGPTQTVIDLTTLPDSFATFDWQNGYLAWTVIVEGPATDLPILDVFQFIDDICDLVVTPLSESADVPDRPEVAVSAEIATPVPPAPPAMATSPAAPMQALDMPAKAPQAKKSNTTLRVDPERVDRLMNIVGELIINQSVISQRLQAANLPNASELAKDLDDYKLLALDIQEGVMAIRAQPVKPLFERMSRIAREAADACGKKVDIVISGEMTEVDKTVVERLADPLTHMIRNAVDHGIEAPQKRRESQKPEIGRLELTAYQKSSSIIIELADDGGGINRPRIREIAIEKQLINADDILTEAEIDQLLFRPGFSTAKEITNLSGRGVGMDVVKTAITALGGRVHINSTPGKGTIFTITLPLTLAVMDGMIIHLGDQTMVIPIASIVETIRPTLADLSKIGRDHFLLKVRDSYIPIIDLGQRLGNIESNIAMVDKVFLLIHQNNQVTCAIAVDDIYDQRQVVVKSLHENYGKIDGISGATILGDGKIALIVDPDTIVESTPSTNAKTTFQKRQPEHVATS